MSTPRLVKEDLDIAAWPVALLTERPPEGTTEVTFEASTDRGLSIWRLRGFRLPTVHDEAVYIALLERTREQGKLDEPLDGDGRVWFTFYDLARRLGWPIKGGTYTRLRNSIERLAEVTIRAENAYMDPDTGEPGDKTFHLFDATLVREKARENQTTLPLSFVDWSPEIRRHFLVGWVKSLDCGFYFSLRNTVARSLYRYLDLRGYDEKATFSVRFSILANRIGLLAPEAHRASDGQPKPFWVKRRLEPAHAELIDAGFLGSAEFTETNDGEPMVRYMFSRTAKDLPGGIIGDLVFLGVSSTTAQELVESFNEADIRQQMEWLPFRRPKDKAALLVKAIRERWVAPDSWRRHQEAQKNAQVIYEKRRERKQLDDREDELHDEVERRLAELSGQERDELWAEARRRVGERMAKIPPDSPIIETAADHEVRLIVRERMERE